MNKVMFTGVGVALVTPFTKKGKDIDYDGLALLVDAMHEGGVDFLVPCGTTGESPTLSREEHNEVVAFVVKTAAGRMPVLAGSGSNSTADAVRLSEAAKSANADGVLVVSPYYNKPMEAGLLDYYHQIAKVGLPVILYDIPSRTGKGVPTNIIKKLCNEECIVGIKWASGDFDQFMELVRDLPDDFICLSGDDKYTFPTLALGGKGIISVAANLVPDIIVKMYDMVIQGDFNGAKRLHYKLLPLFRELFCETNPIPVKAVLDSVYHTLSSKVRSPLSELSHEKTASLCRILQKTLS